jgi:hypothetical protein
MKYHLTQAENIVKYFEERGNLDFDSGEQEERLQVVEDVVEILRKDEDEFFAAVNESLNKFTD